MASGPFSVALGDGEATGPNSLAFNSSVAIGTNATAFGGSEAIGTNSTSFGNSEAFGTNSTALGGSNASGSYSIAAGLATSANSYNSFVFGQSNIGLSETNATPNPTSWVPTDPLFEIGNGSISYPPPYFTQTLTRSDAFVVYKNGDAVFSPPPGTTSCSVKAPVFITTTPGGSGDIPMYTGN